MDITATLLDVTGLAQQAPPELDGESLWPQIALATTGADTTQADSNRTFFWRIDLPPSTAWASGPRRAVRRGRWKYLWDGGFGYLFDLWRDPGETRNVLYEHEALARELEALSLSEW